MTDRLRAAAEAAIGAMVRAAITGHADALDGYAEALRAALAEPEGGLYLTIVYRDVQPGPECTELCRHPKVSAVSWSHAIDDRDAARAATPRREWQSLTDEEIANAIRPLCQNAASLGQLLSFSMDEYRAIEQKVKEKNT